MNWELVISAFGAIGVGGIAVSYLGRMHDRRTTRARLLEAVAHLEQSRWDPPSWEIVRAAAREVESLGLINGLPRRAVRQYLALARVAANMSREDAELHDHEYAGGIDGDLFDAANRAVELVVDLTWHPARTRLVMPWRQRGVDRAIVNLSARTKKAYDFHFDRS